MDEADMVAADQSINRMAYTGEAAVARKRKLLKASFKSLPLLVVKH